jgi:hypothetical protein
MENKNLTIAAVALAGFLLLALLLNVFLVPRITAKVIEELKRSYTPGPYDPGFDPDKVNPNALRNSEVSTTQIPAFQD